MRHDGIESSEWSGAVDAAVDLSSASLLLTYFKITGRIVFFLAILFGLWSVGGRSIPWAVTAVACIVLYAGIRRYYRPVLLLVAWGMFPLSYTIAASLLWQSVPKLYRGFGFWHIVPLSVIGTLLYVSHRVLSRDLNTEDVPLRKAGDSLYSDPTFSETWLSGGWRTALMAGTPWLLWNYTEPPEQASACASFGLALFILALTPWVLIPAARAVWAGDPAQLIRAVHASLPKRVSRSYTLFILRQSLKRPLAALALLIAAVCFCAVALSSFRLGALSGSALFLIAAGWYLFWRFISRRILRKAVIAPRVSSEPFTLYLRSFLDDDFSVLRDGLRYRLFISDRMFNALRYVRFEEVLTGTGWPFGKLFTLTRPGRSLPDMGALRVTAEPGNWQQTIMEFVDAADRVVMAVGFTSGLRWELAQFNAARLSKLILAFVPEDPDRKLSTWRQFTLEAPRLSSCAGAVISESVAARFLADGTPVFFTARKRSLVAYRLAMLCCFTPPETVEKFVERRMRAAPPDGAQTAAGAN